ncbi:MAG: hypothetical protein ACLT0X_07390 [Collinsella sp.]
MGDEANGAPNSQKDLEQAEDDAPPKSAFGNGARLSANGLGLAQNKVDGRRKTDERDGGSEHAETPHKLKTYESGGLPDCYLNMHCICGLRTTTSHINAHVRWCGAM